MKIENILKVADIDVVELSPELKELFMYKAWFIYQDLSDGFNWHIYEHDLLEYLEQQGIELSEPVKAEIAEIEKLCNENDCGYFRITF